MHKEWKEVRDEKIMITILNNKDIIHVCNLLQYNFYLINYCRRIN